MPRALSFTAALLALLSLLSCTGGGGEDVSVAVVGDVGAPFETGLRLSPPARLVRAATTEGLVAFDEKGRIVPALAERWIVTDDGLSYIFRLREGTWLDKTPLTGDAVVASLRQTLAALDGTPLGDSLAGIDTVIPRTGRVVEIQLVRPMPDLLLLLAQPELGITRKGRGLGPMSLTRDGNIAVLKPIAPPSRGLPEEHDWAERSRRIRLVSLAATRAIAAFGDGRYDAVLGGTFASYPLARQVGVTAGTTQLDPVSGLFGLIATNSHGILQLPATREALALAIDRDALASALNATGWNPSASAIPPALIAGSEERWTGSGLSERRAEAARRIAEWRGKNAAPEVRIALPQAPGGDLLFDRLSQDFTSIGVTARRVPESAEADLRLIDSVARYPRAQWFFGELACAARRGLCNAAADELAAQALASADPATATGLWKRADEHLTEANIFIPLGAPLRWNLLRRRTSGFTANPAGVHPLIDLAMRPK